MRNLAAGLLINLIGLIFRFQPGDCCPHCDLGPDCGD